MSKIYRGVTIFLAVWLAAWMWLSWPAMQDDAFIHLRYAVNLLQHHIIAYDGVHPDYGTSSLLYVGMLALLRSVFTSPILPRVVSSVFHGLLFGGSVWAFARVLRPAPKLAWAFALLLLGVLAAPMAVRWMDDGMETSLALCLVSLAAFSVSRLCHSQTVSRRSALWLFSLGLFATLTRVEYLLLFGMASLMLFTARLRLPEEAASLRERSGFLRLAARCAAPLLGSLVAAAMIFFTMHSLMPDTAIAKADGSGAWIGTLHAMLSVLVSSFSFGLLLMLFWLVTVAAVIAYKRRLSLPVLLANSLFPLTVALTAVRGQQVQGVRYLVWTLFFPILWNTLELRWSGAEPLRSTSRALLLATYGLTAMLILVVPIESWMLYRLFSAREQSLAAIRAQHLERLGSLNVVAFDVGYIGYFTESPLCDMAGLVNGRVRASLPFEARVQRCAAEHPQYAFVSQFSLGELNNHLDLSGWSLCSVYDFANLRASDLHYLIASPAATQRVCDATGSSPKPVELLLHPASSQ